MLKNTLKLSLVINLLVLTLLSLPLKAKELLMLTDDGPPHMIEVSNSGIDVDITREVLEEMGYTVKLDFAPLNRTMLQVVNKQADLFLPTFFQNDTDKLFISAPIINYHPIAFSLENNDKEWSKHIQKYPKWHNVIGLKKWENPIARAYHIYSTPTYIILDKNKKIIAKPQTLDEVRKIVEYLE